MNITLMAHDKKKELMVQFCTAYKSILLSCAMSVIFISSQLLCSHAGKRPPDFHQLHALSLQSLRNMQTRKSRAMEGILAKRLSLDRRERHIRIVRHLSLIHIFL